MIDDLTSQHLKLLWIISNENHGSTLISSRPSGIRRAYSEFKRGTMPILLRDLEQYGLIQGGSEEYPLPLDGPQGTEREYEATPHGRQIATRLDAPETDNSAPGQ